MTIDEWRDGILEGSKKILETFKDLNKHVKTIDELKASEREHKELQAFFVIEMADLQKKIDALD